MTNPPKLTSKERKLLGLRKFVGFLITITMTWIALLVGRIEGDTWSYVAIFSSAAYFGANALAKRAAPPQ